MRTLLMVCLLLASSAARAEIYRFYGYAFDLATNEYLYTEVHEQEIVGEVWKRGRIRYYDASGTLIGDKPMDFSKNPYIPIYRLDLPGQGYAEGIRAVGETLELFKVSGGREQQKSIRLRDRMAADSGFHAMLRDNFESLMAGNTERFRLVVAGNLDSYGFRARKVGETTFDGRRAIQIVVEPDSLLRLLVDRLELLYEPEQRELLEYRGISNIHDPATGKPYTARIVYPRVKPEGAPATLPPLE